MIRLEASLRAWGTPEFNAVLKREIEQQADALPLQQGLSASSSVGSEPVTALIHGVSEAAEAISIRVGIFYQGLVTGCSCADDPSPPGEVSEYCEVLLVVDRGSGEARVSLLEF